MSNNRKTPIEISAADFKKIGYHLIDSISHFMESIDERQVTTGESPQQLQQIIGNLPLPEYGTPVDEIFSTVANILFDHSLLNGHPKFMGYITSSAAPIGALADLLAAAVN